MNASGSGWKNISVNMRLSGSVKTCLAGYRGQ
jgi:hypothetical protein